MVDPGTGKSKLLEACLEVAVKGLMLSGPMTTAAGLTAAVRKDGSIESGALIAADGGVCCIDDFDKMTHSHTLLEAMEQQIVSVAKSGAIINVPSGVVILAAANPIGNTYVKSKLLQQNARLSPALLSRFYIIFRILRNTPAPLCHTAYSAEPKHTVENLWFATKWLHLRPSYNNNKFIE